MVETRKNQFSVREMIVLMTAFAVWCWVLREASPVETAIFSVIAIVAGVLGHLAYAYFLPWRVTAIATVFLLYNAILIAAYLSSSGSNFRLPDCWDALTEIVMQPAEMAWRTRGTRDGLFPLAIVIAVGLFSPAHPIRPSLPAAIVSAIGLGIWYAVGILVLIYAG